MFSRSSDRSGFFAGADAVATFVLANFVWVVISLTVVGIPLATVGLFAMMSHRVRGYQPELFKVFIGTIRRKWKQALVVGLVDLLAGAFVVTNLTILSMMNPNDMLAIVSRSLTVASGAVLVAANIYVWFLLASVDMPVKETSKLALLLLAKYPLRTIATTLGTILPLVMSLFVPPLFFIFISISVAILIASFGAWKVLQAHFTPSDLEALNLLVATSDSEVSST